MRHQPDPPAPLFGHGFNYREVAKALDKPHPRDIPPVDPNAREQDRPRLTGQNADLLARLKTGERVTPGDALSMGIQRLAARVLDLRQAGYDVRSEWYGDVKRYWLASPTPARAV